MHKIGPSSSVPGAPATKSLPSRSDHPEDGLALLKAHYERRASVVPAARDAFQRKFQISITPPTRVTLNLTGYTIYQFLREAQEFTLLHHKPTAYSSETYGSAATLAIDPDLIRTLSHRKGFNTRLTESDGVITADCAVEDTRGKDLASVPALLEDKGMKPCPLNKFLAAHAAHLVVIGGDVLAGEIAYLDGKTIAYYRQHGVCINFVGETFRTDRCCAAGEITHPQ